MNHLVVELVNCTDSSPMKTMRGKKGKGVTEFTLGVLVSSLTRKLFECVLEGGQLGEGIGTYGLSQGSVVQHWLIRGTGVRYWLVLLNTLANAEGREGGVQLGSSTSAGSTSADSDA